MANLQLDFFRRLIVPFPGESEVVAMHLTVSVLAALILFSMPLQGASATEEMVTVEEEFILEENSPRTTGLIFTQDRTATSSFPQRTCSGQNKSRKNFKISTWNFLPIPRKRKPLRRP